MNPEHAARVRAELRWRSFVEVARALQAVIVAAWPQFRRELEEAARLAIEEERRRVQAMVLEAAFVTGRVELETFRRRGWHVVSLAPLALAACELDAAARENADVVEKLRRGMEAFDVRAVEVLAEPPRPSRVWDIAARKCGKGEQRRLLEGGARGLPREAMNPHRRGRTRG